MQCKWRHPLRCKDHQPALVDQLYPTTGPKCRGTRRSMCPLLWEHTSSVAQAFQPPKIGRSMHFRRLGISWASDSFKVATCNTPGGRGAVGPWHRAVCHSGTTKGVMNAYFTRRLHRRVRAPRRVDSHRSGAPKDASNHVLCRVGRFFIVHAARRRIFCAETRRPFQKKIAQAGSTRVGRFLLSFAVHRGAIFGIENEKIQ